MKTCSKCGLVKAESEFYLRADHKYLSSMCKQCDKDRINERHRKVRDEVLQYMGGCCSVCGYDTCKAALEVHHLDMQEKDFHISKIRSLTLKAKRELDKCVLLCCNCHREAHWS